MIRSHSFRPLLPILAIALLGLAGPASADDDTCVPFSAAGTAFAVGGDGPDFELEAEGIASPGGVFSGTIVGHTNKKTSVQHAVITLTFDNGDTLTFDTKIKPDEATGAYRGTYSIRGGTGAFEGARGEGELLADPAGGTFSMDGTICQ